MYIKLLVSYTYFLPDEDTIVKMSTVALFVYLFYLFLILLLLLFCIRDLPSFGEYLLLALYRFGQHPSPAPISKCLIISRRWT